MNAFESPQELYLCGYEALTDQGFARPVFGSADGANAGWTAVADVPGDAEALILYFEETPSVNGFTHLPIDVPLRLTRCGDQMVHVFLWKKRVCVGTGKELVELLADDLDSIAEEIPLTALALAQYAGRDERRLARSAAQWWRQNFGVAAEMGWLSDSLFRDATIREIRRATRGDAREAEIVALAAGVSWYFSGEGWILRIPAALRDRLGEQLRRVQRSITPLISYFGTYEGGFIKLNYVNSSFDFGPAHSMRNSSQSESYFWDLIRRGDDAIQVWRLEAAGEAFMEALDLAKNQWPERREESVAHARLGELLQAQGNRMAALAEYRNGMAIIGRLADANPANTEWQRDVSIIHSKIGDLLFTQGEGMAALAEYRKGISIHARLAAADPDDTEWQHDLSVGHERIGDVLAAQWDGEAALTEYRRGVAIRERLVSSDPTNLAWQRALSISLDRIGAMLVALGDYEEALAYYRRGMDIAMRLAAANPNNAEWQRDLAVSHNRVGDVLVTLGKSDVALAEFRRGMAIAARLTAANPDNAEWQRDLSVSHNKIGTMLEAQEDHAAALAEFRQGMAIRSRLAATDAANAELQRDLSVNHNRIGDVLLAQGQGMAALAEFRKGMDIAVRLAAADPANAERQRDLSVSHEKIGTVLAVQGDGTAALSEFYAALAICNGLLARNAADVQARLASVVPLVRIGETLGADGRAELDAALAILRPLAAADRLDHRRKSWIPRIEAALAALDT